MATQEGPATDDDSYMGYSVTVGDFYGEGIQGAAVGMPRGADLEGKVCRIPLYKRCSYIFFFVEPHSFQLMVFKDKETQ